MTDELKPCPFCGDSSPWAVHFQDEDDPEWDTHCIRCICGAEGATRATPEMAIEAWNRRALASADHVEAGKEKTDV